MAGSCSSTAIRTASRAISASVFLLIAAAGAALSDDLKGYSIEATYTVHLDPGVVVAGRMPPHGLNPVLHHDKIYVSVLGNVFVYSDASSGNFASHGGDETQLDQAKSLSRDRMRAWTVEGSRLLRVQQVIEGIIVETFAVDPGKTACIVSYELHPDAKTNRTVMETLSGVSVEVKAINASSPTCTVRKGNLFATDQ